MVPRVHGITGFVVPTPKGDVPISSTVRKVPALWNMTARTGRRTAVLGWWGSWPAEEIDGVVVTDRALLEVPSRVSPASYLPVFEADLAAVQAGLDAANSDPTAPTSSIVTASGDLARNLLEAAIRLQVVEAEIELGNATLRSDLKAAGQLGFLYGQLANVIEKTLKHEDYEERLARVESLVAGGASSSLEPHAGAHQ